MPAHDSPAVIVARWLKSNNYTASYDQFLEESNLDPGLADGGRGSLTLERLLEEKRAFDVAGSFEKVGEDGGEGEGWRGGAPEEPKVLDTLPAKSNVLAVGFEEFEGEGRVLLVSTADRRLHLLDPATHALRDSIVGLQDGPILSFASFQRRYLLTASMSGQLLLSDLRGRVVERRRDHNKYVVKIAVLEGGDDCMVATAGWDNKIHIYNPSTASNPPQLGTPTATITLPTKPESLLFLRHPEDNAPLLLLSRTDSSSIYYYTTTTTPKELGKQNLAPHSNAWVAFTPSALALHPTDPTLLAVATSSIPQMKLLITRLLIPPYNPLPRPAAPPIAALLDDATAAAQHETQASQARAALAIADREFAALRSHVNTGAPQTAYSTPAVAWRPGGDGVWVNGDDGVVRGFEAVSGKAVVELKGGHEVGSKVRCLWAGHKEEGESAKGEVLISGGFDQRVVVWKAKGGGS
ncbi:hypothetical protein MBLNU230_g2392t1 [Neophaeotheca triangularis]